MPSTRMPVPLAEIVLRQRRSIAQQMRRDPANVLIGIESIDALARRPDALRARHQGLEGLVASIAGIDRGDGVAYLAASGSEPECWCRPVDKGQSKGPYVRVWRAFQRQFYNSDYQAEKDASRWAIDHLYPETAAAREGHAYVRILPVDAVANRNIGTAVERFMARRAHRATTTGHDLTYLTMAKIAGWRGRIDNPVSWKTVYDLVSHVVATGLSHQPGLYPGAYLFAVEVDLTYRSIRRLQGHRWEGGDAADPGFLKQRMVQAGLTPTWKL